MSILPQYSAEPLKRPFGVGQVPSLRALIITACYLLGGYVKRNAQLQVALTAQLLPRPKPPTLSTKLALIGFESLCPDDHEHIRTRLVSLCRYCVLRRWLAASSTASCKGRDDYCPIATTSPLTTPRANSGILQIPPAFGIPLRA